MKQEKHHFIIADIGKANFELLIGCPRREFVEDKYVLWGDIAIRKDKKCYQIYSNHRRTFVKRVRKHLEKHAEVFGALSIRDLFKLYAILGKIERGDYEGD